MLQGPSSNRTSKQLLAEWLEHQSKTVIGYIRLGAGVAALTVLASCGGGGGGNDTPVDPLPVTPQGVTLSGHLSVPSYMVTDSDVNDLETNPASNSSFSSAQSIGNPASVGGYVNIPLAGDNGNSFTNGDIDDYFLVDLKQDQTILLSIGDTVAGDLDLYLYDSNHVEIDRSVGTDKYESLTVPADGRYYVDVYAFDGASNYQLSIGLNSKASLPSGGMRSSDDFVPGEMLVKFKPETASKAKAAMSALGFNLEQSGNALGVQRMTLGSNYLTSGTRISTAGVSSDQQQLKSDTLMAIKQLAKRSDVLYAQPNYRYHTSAIPNDEYYHYQWHYPLINLPQAWDITTGDSGVIVAVIDTGILSAHPDAPAQMVSGYDFIANAASARDGNGIDSNPEDNGDLAFTSKSSFHGTHVAGTIAANSNNSVGTSIGTAGIAWNIKLMPLRALGANDGTDYDIAQAVLYAAGLSNDSGTLPAPKADIINMSIGGAAVGQVLRDAITAARNAGVILIAAAGNESSSAPSYPAALSGVVSVSAVGPDRELAPYSNFGSTIDIAAPGGDQSGDINGDGQPDGVLSLTADDSSATTSYSYGFREGTSMATPHVAGVAALMKSVYPGLTPAIFDTMLANGELTVDLGSSGRDDSFGYGLIDAYKAVAAALSRAGGSKPITPALSVNPSSLNFSTGLQQATVFIEEVGGSIGTVSTSESASWLTVTAASVDSNGFGSYEITVNRSGLADGIYNATIQVNAGSLSKNISVIMQVSSSLNSGGDAGRVYVLLMDHNSDDVIDQYSTTVSGNGANYSFTDVDAGEYQIIAGSDMDMDSYICDPGEACGSYPTSERPTTVTVETSDVSGLDFSTSYSLDTPTTAGADSAAKSSNKGIRRLDSPASSPLTSSVRRLQ